MTTVKKKLQSSKLYVHGKRFRREFVDDTESNDCGFIRAVTVGPFPPGQFTDEQIRDELEKIKFGLGANAVRFYDLPRERWLEDCAEIGLMVFITIPWNQHSDFIFDHPTQHEIKLRVRDVITRFKNNPAIVAVYIGNEIPSQLVRFLGPDRVVAFLEELIDIARNINDQVLYSYANYPSTEFLIPENQDFIAYNVYLEDRQSFSDYLFRLQNLAGNRPVLLSEFGVDTHRNSESTQTKILSWHIEETCKAGVAGTTIFSWNDHWFRGGSVIDDWSFGLTNRELEAKPAHDTIAVQWEKIYYPFDGVKLDYQPSFSIIICTYKGSPYLQHAIESLQNLNYPDYEVIVVNDGNDDRVRELAQSYSHVRHLGIPHGGLSNARNIGAKAAKGEILVYTDDDCFAEPNWLNWLSLAYASDDAPDCVGGPNIPPPPTTKEQAVIISCPGGPSHVLMADKLAEHIPGCNLSVRKSALETIDGFDEQYWTAGDDVDFCWRLLDAGFKIGFHPSAFVWHYRRSTYRAYIKQQKGYGKAEALLKHKHINRFSSMGGAKWGGFVYEGPMLTYSRGNKAIYHGQMGHEPFQFIYPDQYYGYHTAFVHFGTLLIIALFIALGFFAHPVFWLGAGGLALIGWVAIIKAAFKVGLHHEFDTLSSRLKITGLIIHQGLSRSWVRMTRAFLFNQPIRFIIGLIQSYLITTPHPRFSSSFTLRFWDDNQNDRNQFNQALQSLEPKAKPHDIGTYDFDLHQGIFLKTTVISATEYHNDHFWLTQIRMTIHLKFWMFLLALLVVIGSTYFFLLNPLWTFVPLAILALGESWLITMKGLNLIRHAAEKASLSIYTKEIEQNL